MKKIYEDDRRYAIIQSVDGGNYCNDIIEFESEINEREIEEIVDKYDGDLEYYITMLNEINNKYKIKKIICSNLVPTIYFN